MATKKIKNQVDNKFDLDDDLSFDDLDFDIDPFKDTRSPMMKIKDGLKDGVKSKAAETAFIKGVLRELLPKGFGDTMDLSDKIGDNIGKLYREGADQVRPAIKDFKRVSSRLIPKDNKYVPDSVKAILKKWEEDTKVGASDLSAGNQRDMMITQQLGEIFKEQTVQSERDKTEADVKNRIQEAVELNRHKDIFGLLNQSNISLSRISQYQTTINLQFQKKSLELQHRQLFALYDLVSASKATHALQADSFQKIVTNTGLPDWQKIKLTEFAHQRAFQKFTNMMGTATQGLMPNAGDYMQMTARKVRDKFMGSLKSNMSDFRSGLTEAESGAQQVSGMGDMVDKTEMGANVASGMATESLGKWAAGKLRDPLETRFPKVKRAGDYLENFNENIVTSAEKFRKNTKYRNQAGPMNWIKAQIQDLLPSLGQDASFNKLSTKDLNSVHPYTIKTDRSINEIIPGYLSRILREMQITRTGNSNLEMVVYDQDRGRFTNESKVLRSIASNIFSKREADRTTVIMDSLIADIDPEGKLNAGERKKLAKAILKNKSEYKDLSTGLKGTAKELTDKLMEDKSKDPREMLVWNRRLSSLIQGASDPRPIIEEYIAQGRHKELINLGLIREERGGYALNTDVIYNIKLGEDPYETMMAKGKPKKRPTTKHKDKLIDEENKSLPNAGFMSEKMKSALGSAKDRASNSTLGRAFTGGKNAILGFDIRDKVDVLKAQEEMRKSGTGLRAAFERLKLRMRRKWKELYVQGEDQPRMQDDKLAAGHYVDAISGDTLKSLDDIAGPVRDIISGKVVLKSDEIAQTVIKDAQGKTSVFSEDTINKAEGYFGKENVDKARATFSKMIKDVKSSFADIKSKLSDKWKELYVRGRSEPSLSADKMASGDYIDVVTGKTIHSLDDIQNGVKDITVDKVVLNADQIKESAVKDANGKMYSFEDYTKKTFEQKVNKGAAGKSNSMFGKMFMNAKNVFNKLKDSAFNTARDVWVQGEREARLSAINMQKGYYKDAITGKIIYSPEDIAGPVLDEKGETKITAEDLPNLVVWSVESRRFGPIRKLARGLGKIMSAIGWYYKKIGIPLTIWNFKMMAKAARVGTNITRSLFGSGPYSVKDVYVGSEKEPRLYAVKIRNGDYLDKSTGKPIFHHKDIKGEIVDINGETKISPEDLPNLQVYNSVFKVFNPLKLVGWVAKKGVQASIWLTKKGAQLSKSIVKGMGTLAGATIGKVARYLSKPEDVYVKGEGKPRLEAALMKMGRYVSEKTGKTIELPADIDGPVWDAEEEVRIISDKDLEKGLVRFNGQPIKTSFMKKIGNVFTRLNKLFSVRGAIGGKRGFEPIKGVSDKAATDPAEKTNEILTDIKDIFKKQFGKPSVKGDTDGDGDREGSWQDILQKRAAAKAGKKTPETGAKAPKEKSNGIMGLIMGALDAITGFIGGFGKLLKGTAVVKGIGSLLGLGGAATAAAGTTAAAGASTAAAGGLGAGLMAVMSNPITLGILGAAVVGYGAYRGIKAINKWMTKPSSVELIRYVQYGFKKDNTDKFSRVLELEAYVKDLTKVGSDTAEIDDKKLDIKEVMSIFGMNADADDEKTQFGSWYMKRFKPVYLTHVSAMNLIDGSIDLSKVNGLKKDNKLKYIEAIKFPSGPYTFSRLPTMDRKMTAANSKDVAEAVEAALKELSGTGKGADAKSSIPGSDQSKKAPTAGKPTRGGIDSPDGKPKTPGSSSTTTATVALGNLTGNLSAFDIVRYKTYGLVDLETAKIIALSNLENIVSKKIVYQNEKATLDANPLEILNVVTTGFGIPSLMSKPAEKWVKWFKNRFLPVYLNYCTLYMEETGKSPKPNTPVILKPNKQLEIAKAIAATSGAWSADDSPWESYILNTDPESIQGNIEFLTKTAKAVTQPDKVSKEASEKDKARTAEIARVKKSYQATIPESGYVPKTSGGNDRYVMPGAAPSVPRANPEQLAGTVPKGTGTSFASADSNYVMPGSTKRATGEHSNLLDFIGIKESRGNYNILVGGKTEPNLTNMTIAEVLEYQSGMLRRGHESTAVGKYQIIKATLQDLIKKGYASPSDKFSPEVQDRLAVGLLKRRGLDQYLGGKIDKEQFADNLSKEWASLPYKTGASFYAGVGSNKSAGTRDAFVSVVASVNPGGSSVAQSGGFMKTSAATAVSAEQNTLPKSVYNPVARPEAMKRQAVESTRQAASPMADAAGFTHSKPASTYTGSNANNNTVTANVMVNTENILSQSLDVQKQTLDVMKMIFEKINGAAPQGNKPAGNSPGAQTASYQAPKVPVPLRKT
jgi:hypothetical protein